VLRFYNSSHAPKHEGKCRNIILPIVLHGCGTWSLTLRGGVGTWTEDFILLAPCTLQSLNRMYPLMHLSLLTLTDIPRHISFGVVNRHHQGVA
jgi:hypothetical protein